MIISKVKLNNFRCHEGYILEFKNQTTQILGENGWGKTSILEAIYLSVRGKSFKAVDKEILRRGADFYRVELSFLDGEKVVVSYDGKKRMFLVADKKSARLPKKNRYPVVLFEPADLALITSSPTRRRDYFDRFLTQLFESYSVSLSRYNKALKQRNELLKREFVTIDDMFSYVPYQLSGYYGLYDSCVGIDDLENMSEPERIMAMLFMTQEFNFEENSYDNQKNIEYLEQITDKTVQQKMIEIRKNNEDLSKVYKYFCQDYKNEQYKKDKFTESFLYLFERIMRDTGCGFIDMLPEESANSYSGWEELPYAIEGWRDYKEKEKRHSKFIKELNRNKKLNKRFYQFLFEEVIARYR